MAAFLLQPVQGHSRPLLRHMIDIVTHHGVRRDEVLRLWPDWLAGPVGLLDGLKAMISAPTVRMSAKK
jgi:hypothetical protein